MYRLEVLNPVAQLREEMTASGSEKSSTLSTRPSTLDGKVVGLLWDAKGKGDETLKGIGGIFTAQFKDVEIKFYRGGHPSTAAVLAQAAAECDVVVGGFAD